VACVRAQSGAISRVSSNRAGWFFRRGPIGFAIMPNTEPVVSVLSFHCHLTLPSKDPDGRYPIDL